MTEPTSRLIPGDCLRVLPTLDAGSVHCCVTSPPYFGLRDYGADGQLGLESTPEEYVARMVEVFRGVRRALRDDGTLWLNLGDSYASGETGRVDGGREGRALGAAQKPRGERRISQKTGLPHKQLLGIPWRVAFALQADGWYLRSDIIWSKPNPMPESVRDRPTKSHEYLFLLAKSDRYYYDTEAAKEPSVGSWRATGILSPKTAALYEADPKRHCTRSPLSRRSGDVRRGRNRRTVWTVATRPYKGAHFATFPPQLVEPCVLAGCPAGGTVLDPFAGAGTTGMVALRHGRNFLGLELNPAYLELARERIAADKKATEKVAV